MAATTVSWRVGTCGKIARQRFRPSAENPEHHATNVFSVKYCNDACCRL
jgi:hypothetical protein